MQNWELELDQRIIKFYSLVDRLRKSYHTQDSNSTFLPLIRAIFESQAALRDSDELTKKGVPFAENIKGNLAARFILAIEALEDLENKTDKLEPGVLEKMITSITEGIQFDLNEWKNSLGLTASKSFEAREAFERERLDFENERNELEHERAMLVERMNSQERLFEELLNKSQETQQQLARTSEAYKELREFAERPLEKANRTSASGAFLSGAERAASAMKKWLTLLYCSIAAIFLLGTPFVRAVWTVVEPKSSHVGVWQAILDGLNSSFPQILTRISLILPLVWLAWFAARQHGYASRLHEDYAFKKTMADAYEGFKDVALGVDHSMHEKLMAATISSFSVNPLRIYNIASEPSQTEEVMGLVKKTTELAKDIKDISSNSTK